MVCWLLSQVLLFVTLWAVACQAPLSMEFSKQKYWSGLSFPSPGISLTQRSNPGLLQCRQILYQLSYQGMSINRYVNMIVQEGRHKLLKILIPLLQYLVGLSS